MSRARQGNLFNETRKPESRLNAPLNQVHLLKVKMRQAMSKKHYSRPQIVDWMKEVATRKGL